MRTQEDNNPISHEAQQVITRYRNGYRVAGALDGVGTLAQVAGALVIVGGVLYIILGPSGAFTWTSGILAIVLGFILGLLGILVSAIGQAIKATFDTAVHSSPFLSEGQKAVAMSL